MHGEAADLVEHVVGANQFGIALDEKFRAHLGARFLIGNRGEDQIAFGLDTRALHRGDDRQIHRAFRFHVDGAAAP